MKRKRTTATEIAKEKKRSAYFVSLKSNKGICKTIYASSPKKAVKKFAVHLKHLNGQMEVFCQPVLTSDVLMYTVTIKTSYDITRVTEQ